jgi:predicted  nucleic acid-binding Zn ribbon protein
MYMTELQFHLKENKESQQVEHAIYSLLSALRNNGQIIGAEFSVAKNVLTYHSFVMIPELNSLDKSICNKHVELGFSNLEKLGTTFTHKIIGEEVCSDPVCKCSSPGSYILYTRYLLMNSPLRCGDCFGVIPLYKIPPTDDDEYKDIIWWQGEYLSFDSIQLSCGFGERYGKRQISRYDSRLSKQGLDICSNISELTGRKTYYYLYRDTSYRRGVEMKRKCPCCGGEWILDKPLHDLFDFCCNKCGLLSNISWAVR